MWLCSVVRSCATQDDVNKDHVCTPTISPGINRPPHLRSPRKYRELRDYETSFIATSVSFCSRIRLYLQIFLYRVFILKQRELAPRVLGVMQRRRYCRGRTPSRQDAYAPWPQGTPRRVFIQRSASLHFYIKLGRYVFVECLSRHLNGLTSSHLGSNTRDSNVRSPSISPLMTVPRRTLASTTPS